MKLCLDTNALIILFDAHRDQANSLDASLIQSEFPRWAESHILLLPTLVIDEYVGNGMRGDPTDLLAKFKSDYYILAFDMPATAEATRLRRVLTAKRKKQNDEKFRANLQYKADVLIIATALAYDAEGIVTGDNGMIEICKDVDFRAYNFVDALKLTLPNTPEPPIQSQRIFDFLDE